MNGVEEVEKILYNLQAEFFSVASLVSSIASLFASFELISAIFFAATFALLRGQGFNRVVRCVVAPHLHFVRFVLCLFLGLLVGIEPISSPIPDP